MIIKKNKINKFFIFLLIFKNIFGSNSINLNDFFKTSVTSLISIGGSFAVFYNFLYKPLKVKNNSYKENIKYFGGILNKYDSHIRKAQTHIEILENINLNKSIIRRKNEFEKNEIIKKQNEIIKENFENNNEMLIKLEIASGAITKLSETNNILKEIIKINDPQSFNLFYQEGSDNLDLDNDLKKAKELLQLKIEQNKNENTNTQKIYPINNYNYHNYQQNNITIVNGKIQFDVRYKKESQNNFSELNTENLNQKSQDFNSEFTELLNQNNEKKTLNFNTLNPFQINKLNNDFEKFKNPSKNMKNFKFFGSKIIINNKK